MDAAPDPALLTAARILIQVIGQPPEFARDALCDPTVADRLMFGIASGRPRADGSLVGRTREAAEFCLDCKVMIECRDYARLTEQPAGVWGGETAAERWAYISRAAAPLEGDAA